MPLTRWGPWARQPAARSSHHCWQQPEATGCHIPGGDTSSCTQGGGISSEGAVGRDVAACSQDGITHGNSISSSTGHRPLPAASMWGPDFPPFCRAIPWCPTPARRRWQAEAHSDLCRVSRTSRATLAHPGAPYQHPARTKTGKGVAHMEVTPRARSPSLGSPRVLPGPSPAPQHPQLGGNAAPALGLCPRGCHQHCQGAQTDAHTGRALHRPMSLDHSWTLGSGPHPYGINGTLTSATASD